MQHYAHKLKCITGKAKQDKNWIFGTLACLINRSSLVECYKELNIHSACGIDGVSVREYGSNLGTNIADLLTRLEAIDYKPLPVKRVFIPKPEKNEMRPLGLPSVEDKLVQMVLKKILEAIFEPDFLPCSHGFRFGKSCHTAIKELNTAIMKKQTNYLVEVDIRKCFDSFDHKWLYEMLKQRISDPVFLGLIWRILKAGVIENNKKTISDKGTPQGGIISPILANIYLHFVLDLWFELRFKKRAKGYVELIRYADDFVVACESKHDADMFLQELRKRLAKFKLEVSEEKTQVISFGKNAFKKAKRTGKKVRSFNFLGFTHYCRATRKGWLVVGCKTAKERLANKLKALNKWLKDVRNACSTQDWWKVLAAKLRGFYGYFGISGNIQSLRKFYQRALSMCFKWLNRRSQKKSMNWEKFIRYLQWNPLPEPRIYHKILF